MVQKLENVINVHKINEWLAEKKIVFENLHSRFADGVLVAKILKDLRPKLVDMNSYKSHSSLSQRLLTWDLLNVRVLDKLNLPLANDEMENIAKAMPGAIEKLLLQIMQIKSENFENYIENQEEDLKISDHAITNVLMQTTEGVQYVSVVPFMLYERAAVALETKEDLIEMEQRKMSHLENLLKLRDQRIEDLRQQIDMLKN